MIKPWEKKLFNALKEEMKSLIESMTEETIIEIQEQLGEQFELALSILGYEKREVEVVTETFSFNEDASNADKEKNEETEEQPIDKLAESFHSEPALNSYKMKRNLFGGTLLGSDNVFVPEKIIRENDFEDGDTISIKLVSQYLGKPIYEFSLVEKGIPSSNRNEFKYAVVDYDEYTNRYFVEKNYMGEDIRYDDTPQRLYLQPQHVTRMGISKGDVIDLSWYGNNIFKFQIPWRYNFSDLKDLTEHKKMLNYRPEKSEEETEAASEEDLAKLSKAFKIKEHTENLNGFKISVVGGYSFHTQAKEIIEKHNGYVHLVKDNAHLMNMTSKIKNSDLVVIIANHVSHRDEEEAKKRAKRYNVPFTVIRNFGKESLIKTIIEEKEKLD